jgi:hypothetical protein
VDANHSFFSTSSTRAAQNADTNAKPIGVVFALVGLYLHVECRFSGRQVQDVHMRLGRLKQRWPTVTVPTDRGRLTPTDVLAARAGTERDAAIDAWCSSVWNAYADANRATVETLLRQAHAVA